MVADNVKSCWSTDVDTVSTAFIRCFGTNYVTT